MAVVEPGAGLSGRMSTVFRLAGSSSATSMRRSPGPTATVRFSEELCERVRAGTTCCCPELGSLDAMRKHLTTRLEELDSGETTYVRLVGKPGPSWGNDFDLLAAPALGSGLSKRVLVEVMTRYSNNPTLVDDLRSTRDVVLSRDEDDEPELGGQHRVRGRRWAMAHRLTAEDVRAVVNGYRAGRTARELAERFSVSESSVKRLVRRAGCRRRGVPPAADPAAS